MPWRTGQHEVEHARAHTRAHTWTPHARTTHTLSHSTSRARHDHESARGKKSQPELLRVRLFARVVSDRPQRAQHRTVKSLLKLVARVRSNPQMLQLSTVAPAEQNTQRSPKAWIPSHPWAMERAPELLERAAPELVLGLALRRALERATRARSSCTSPAQALTALATSGLRFAPSPRSASALAGSAAAPCRRLD